MAVIGSLSNPSTVRIGLRISSYSCNLFVKGEKIAYLYLVQLLGLAISIQVKLYFLWSASSQQLILRILNDNKIAC